MITTLIDGLNTAPVLGNSKVSRSVKDASAPNFADAMQNLSTEREPVSSSVVDDDSVSPAVSQENALSSELRDEPDPNELQHAMDESTMDMIKSGQSVTHNPVKPATNVSADAAAVLSVGGAASTASLVPGGFGEAINGLVASPMVPVSPTAADGGQTRLAMPAVQGAQMSAEGLESASIKASVASPLDSVMVAGDAKNTVNASHEVSALVGESLRTSRSGNAVQSDARVESFVDKTPLSVAAGALSKADSNVSSSRVLDLPSRVSANESQQFGNAMATHVRVLKNQGGGEAKVNLHPAELGRMSISVTTDGNETRVAFVVETSQARQAVEAAMPRLRDMLDSAGLSLSDSDVSERRDQQADTNEGRSDTSKTGMTSLHGEDGIEATVVSVSVDPDRLIDIYT